MTNPAPTHETVLVSQAAQARKSRGAKAYFSGLAAEDQVAATYERANMPVVLRRWRGKGGEIDLIARDGSAFVFVEVKQSRTHDRAATHLRPAQLRRLWASAEEFLALTPRGSPSEVRFDLALVDGQGKIEIIRNIFH